MDIDLESEEEVWVSNSRFAIVVLCWEMVAHLHFGINACVRDVVCESV